MAATETLGGIGERVAWHEPHSIVLDNQPQQVALQSQTQSDSRGLGVLNDIAEAFLNDSRHLAPNRGINAAVRNRLRQVEIQGDTPEAAR